MLDLNSSLANQFGKKEIENPSKIENKNIEGKSENKVETFEQEAEMVEDKQTFSNYKSGAASANVVFFPEKTGDIEKGLEGKENLEPNELELLSFINDMKDQSFKEIIKAFDQMLENARKMREQAQEYYKKVVQPKEDIMKKEMLAEAAQKKNV